MKMKLLRMILSGSAALVAIINGYADAADNNVPMTSEFEEGILNKQTKTLVAVFLSPPLHPRPSVNFILKKSWPLLINSWQLHLV